MIYRYQKENLSQKILNFLFKIFAIRYPKYKKIIPRSKLLLIIKKDLKYKPLSNVKDIYIIHLLYVVSDPQNPIPKNIFCFREIFNVFINPKSKHPIVFIIKILSTSEDNKAPHIA